MNTEEIAARLIELCREGKDIEAINELYADDAVSYEPEGMPNGVATGKDTILANTQKFMDSMEHSYSSYINEPIVAGNFFACTMGFDADVTDWGRMKVDEVAVYEVKNGKIATIRFFYSM